MMNIEQLFLQTRDKARTSGLTISIVLEVLASEIGKGKEIKHVKFRKEEIKSLCFKDILVYIENTKAYVNKTYKQLELIHYFRLVHRL
jgi:hypothetical protein